MADVRIQVGGYQYDVHCGDGQEDQLLRLAQLVDDKVRAVQGGTEVRQLLYAALFLADEAHEAKGAAAAAQAQAQEIANRPPPPPQVVTQNSPALGRALTQMADRVEAVADYLEANP
ncbi:MAG: hypothetical protein RLZZ58_2273 [Pseudomonadota bacterium]